MDNGGGSRKVMENGKERYDENGEEKERMGNLEKQKRRRFRERKKKWGRGANEEKDAKGKRIGGREEREK